MNSKTINTRNILISGLLSLSTAVVWAQEGGEAQEGSMRSGAIEEVVVTAQKKEQLLQEVPIAVTAFTGEQLARKQAVTLEALQGEVPNVQIGHFNNTPRTAVFNIRGMGVIESNLYGGNTVQIVVDGVPHVFTMLSLLNNLYDIERIEVNRGPQGTLYGANSTGGVVNIITKQPTGEYGGNARITVGNWNRLDANAAMDFPISDSLAGKVTVMHHSRDGWVTDVTNNTDMGSRNTTAVRGYLKWDPGSDFEATLITQVTWARDGAPFSADGSVPGEVWYQPPGTSPGPGQGVMYQHPCQPNRRCEAPDDYYSANNPTLPDISNLDIFEASLTMNWETSFGEIVSITGYKDFDLEEYTDNDGTPWYFMDTHRPTDGWQFNQELRANISLRDNVELIVGGYGHYQTYHHVQNFRPMFALPGLRQLTQEFQDKWSVSLFAHSFIDLTPRLRLQAGVRFSHEDTEMTDTSENFLNLEGDSVWSGDTFLNGFEVSADDSWNEWAAKLGLDYEVSDEILAYGYVARGFKSGGFVGRIVYPEDIGPYDPEYVYTVEGGLKSDWLDGRLRVNAAVFYNKYEDMQLPIIYYTISPDTGSIVHSTTILNAAEADTAGVELEVSAVPVDGLTINASLGYLHAEYSDFPFVDPATLEETNLEGYRLQNAPEWSGTFGARYEFRVGPGTATIGAKYQYVDKKYNTNLQNTPRSEVQPTHLVDANIEWRPDDGRWSVSLWALNLADKRYISSVFDAGAGLFGLVSYLPPRQYGVSFNYNW